MPRNLSTNVRNALDAAQRLDGYGIDLPAEAAKWLEKLTELQDNPPEEPPRNQVATLLADSAKPAQIDRAIVAKLSSHLRVGQHNLATQIVGGRLLDAVLDDRDRLHADLAIHAAALIERLHKAAPLTESIADLTRARRVEDAHMAATADADAEDLRQVYATRDKYLTPLGMDWPTGWWDCSRFSNPWEIEHPSPAGDSQWERWKASIQRGGRLWFVPIEEAHAASRPHEPNDVLPPINPKRGGVATFR